MHKRFYKFKVIIGVHVHVYIYQKQTRFPGILDMRSTDNTICYHGKTIIHFK